MRSTRSTSMVGKVERRRLRPGAPTDEQENLRPVLQPGDTVRVDARGDELNLHEGRRSGRGVIARVTRA